MQKLSNTKKSAALQVKLMEVAITFPTTTLKALISIQISHDIRGGTKKTLTGTQR